MSIPSESEESPFDIASKAGKKQTIFLYRKTLKKADVEQVELHGKIKFYKLRTKWSWAILIWVSFILIFNVILVRNTGLGYWNFEKYGWLIKGIFGGNLVQIIGMGIIVVNFLFPSFKKDLKSDES